MPAKKKASASKKAASKKHAAPKKVTEEHVIEPPSDASQAGAVQVPSVTTSVGQPVNSEVPTAADIQSVHQEVVPSQSTQVNPAVSVSSVPASSSVQAPVAGNAQFVNPQAENTSFQPIGVPSGEGGQAQQTISNPSSGSIVGKPDAIDQSNTFGPLPEPESKSKLWVFLVVLVLISALGGGGYFYYSQFMQKASSDSEKAEVTPTQAPENQESSSSAEMEVKLDEYNIKVLNGSGARGEAGSVQSSLEDAGFTVSEIGNADNSDYEKTLIQHKKDVKKGFLDKLKEELEKSYELDKNEELPSSASDDVIVIIGSTKAASDTSEESEE